MSRQTASLPPSYFEARYRADSDPWRFETSDYERAKYAATLAALPQRRYSSALEIGCSVGVLTTTLAERCDELVAVDVSEAALSSARDRNRHHGHIRFGLCQTPGSWPSGRFDLILLSEVVYYLNAADVARLAGRVRDSLNPGGDAVLVHWTSETDYPLSGDEAAGLFIARVRDFMTVAQQAQTDAYRLDVLTRTA